MKHDKASRHGENDRKRSLRIIGGDWRSRKISFTDNAAVRPTPDRIRETLFNWLKLSIPGARCLELYAGSGILSMEALSRGASHVTLVDHGADTVATIQRNLKMLSEDAKSYCCIQSDALDWIAKQEMGWDIIFLDPPFDQTELERLLPLIASKQLLVDDGLVYIETPRALADNDLPEQWKIYRSKKAGSVHYCLCCLK